MKYLKLFLEQKIDVESITKDVMDIAYILEDEGYLVECGVVLKNTKKDHIYSHLIGPHINTLWIKISNVFDKNKLIKNMKFPFKSAFSEFLDRLEDILIKYNINTQEILGHENYYNGDEFIPGRYIDYSALAAIVHSDDDSRSIGLEKYYLLNYNFNQ